MGALCEAQGVGGGDSRYGRDSLHNYMQKYD